MKSIFYQKLDGWKYRLVRPYEHACGVFGREGGSDFISIDALGVLRFSAGYAWDGASGPTIDTRSAMRGSLVHDGLYQLIRLGVLPYEAKDIADVLLRDICLEDGMWGLRAHAWYDAVQAAGSVAVRPQADPRVYEAP